MELTDKEKKFLLYILSEFDYYFEHDTEIKMLKSIYIKLVGEY